MIIRSSSRFLFIALFLVSGLFFFELSGQPVYKSVSGSISFFSSAPLEDIKAEVKSFTSDIDPGNSSVTFTVPIKGFTFRKNLMQQHFNEQYMESDRFPVAAFNGRLERSINPETDLNRPLTVKIRGTITIKGVSRPLEQNVILTLSGDEIAGRCIFNVSLAEFGIKIPRMFTRNIAENVEVTIDVRYKKSEVK